MYKRQALGNEFIVLLKDTSLITVIGGKELLYAAQGIMNRTYEPMFPLLGEDVYKRQFPRNCDEKLSSAVMLHLFIQWSDP